MYMNNAARRALLTIALVGLVGCSSRVLIGDPNRPLMAPGEGLVAASVAFSRTAPESDVYRGFLYSFQYEPTDGSKNELYFGTRDWDPRYDIKTAREPLETTPYLILHSAKPGKYRLTRNSVIGEGTFNFWPKDAMEIEVVAGHVTYLGSTVFEYKTSYRGLGVLTPTSMVKNTRNDFDRDMADLRAVEKRLESVPTRNALTR